MAMAPSAVCYTQQMFLVDSHKKNNKFHPTESLAIVAEMDSNKFVWCALEGMVGSWFGMILASWYGRLRGHHPGRQPFAWHILQN